MKVIRNLAAVKKLVATLFCISLFSLAGHAQSVFRGTFNLQESVRWDRAVLPAGEYKLTIDSVQRPMRAVVQRADLKQTVMFVSNSISDVKASGSSLRLNRGEGALPTVHSLNLPQLGIALIYKTPSQSEWNSAGKTADTLTVVTGGN